MTLNNVIKALVILGLALHFSSAGAAERNVFKEKNISQHELTRWENQKMDAEFKSVFTGANSAGFQKLNNDPWAAKKTQNSRRVVKSKTLAASWGGCRDYSYKRRKQCYARGGDAYTCERYYDARVTRCNDKY